MARLIYSGLTDRGRIRKRNEDSWFADPEIGLFVVSDGMGGHAAGDVASRIVVNLLPQLFRRQIHQIKDLSNPNTAKLLFWALNRVNTEIRQEGARMESRLGMGATVVLALIREDKAVIAHLGDSRAYLWGQKHLIQLTKDHSAIQQLLDAGKISPKDALTHPARGQITRCVGLSHRVQPDIQLVNLNSSDRLLLCSDGLTGMVSDETIAELLVAYKEPHKACQVLVDTANEAGGVDNITAVLIDWQRE